LQSALNEDGFKKYLALRREILLTRLEYEDDPMARGGLKELKNLSRLKDEIVEKMQKARNGGLTTKEE
jgi:hypothetical protein